MAAKISLISALLGLGLGAAHAQNPLSAIDWLNDASALPVPRAVPVLPPEEAVSSGITTETITVTPLDAPSSDAVGLLPRAVSGLPANFWGPTGSDELAALLESIETSDLMPATRELLYTILLAELDPPVDSDASGTFFAARVDTLTRMGAVESAQALLERAGTDDQQNFTRWFDLSLLLGTESKACIKLKNSPGLAASLSARVFCLARTGDWNAAALSFGTGRALGHLDPSEEALLLRFLDAGLSENAPRLPTPEDANPLTFQLYEAIGEPLNTASLPVAFAHADLRSNTGWKAQVEAAERLARDGAITANKLLGLYTERSPAASGGVWDRVEAVQTFDLSLASGSSDALTTALPVAWQQMKNVGLEPVFAELYSDRLRLFELSDDAGELAFRMALLTRNYETAAQKLSPNDQVQRFLKAVAQGNVTGIVPPDERAAAVADGFLATQATGTAQAFVDQGALGAALLYGIKLMGDGAKGDIAKLTDAISLFRAVGLEDVARRAALEVLILDRRG